MKYILTIGVLATLLFGIAHSQAVNWSDYLNTKIGSQDINLNAYTLSSKLVSEYNLTDIDSLQDSLNSFIPYLQWLLQDPQTVDEILVARELLNDLGEVLNQFNSSQPLTSSKTSIEVDALNKKLLISLDNSVTLWERSNECFETDELFAVNELQNTTVGQDFKARRLEILTYNYSDPYKASEDAYDLLTLDFSSKIDTSITQPIIQTLEVLQKKFKVSHRMYCLTKQRDNNYNNREEYLRDFLWAKQAYNYWINKAN